MLFLRSVLNVPEYSYKHGFLLLFEKYLTCTSCIHLEYIGVEEVKNLSETFGC